jgi:hypothetical protein
MIPHIGYHSRVCDQALGISGMHHFFWDMDLLRLFHLNFLSLAVSPYPQLAH